jgi:DoxX-like family
MTSDGQTAGVSKGKLWTGRIISAILVLFLLADGLAKVMKAGPVLKAFDELGYARTVAVPIGILLLVCTILYAIPRTSIFGAILLTGYLGGATATHVRAGQPFYFPIVFGVLVWLGLFLRETRLHALVPLRNSLTAG